MQLIFSSSFSIGKSSQNQRRLTADLLLSNSKLPCHCFLSVSIPNLQRAGSSYVSLSANPPFLQDAMSSIHSVARFLLLVKYHSYHIPILSFFAIESVTLMHYVHYSRSFAIYLSLSFIRSLRVFQIPSAKHFVSLNVEEHFLVGRQLPSLQCIAVDPFRLF